jgi:dihydrolipoamide dehydrogenase
MAGVNGYKDGVVAKLYKGLQGLVKSRKINLVEGTGQLEAPNAVVVGDDRYVGHNVVLATGSYAKSLPGLDIGGRVITSNEAIHLDSVPNRVVVLGGGVIGVEFASVFRSFGAEVTIVEALPRPASPTPMSR